MCPGLKDYCAASVLLEELETLCFSGDLSLLECVGANGFQFHELFAFRRPINWLAHPYAGRLLLEKQIQC